MKLTKLQRYTAYCILLEEYEIIAIDRDNDIFRVCYGGGNICGICDLIQDILHLSDETNPISKLGLVEFLKFGRGKTYYWFINSADRIAALKQCIAETAPK